MTLIAVPISVSGAGDVADALHRAQNAATLGARLIEWRIDALAGREDGHAIAARLVRESPTPCIVTCRAESEGGTAATNEVDRQHLIQAVLSSADQPCYVDVELAAFQQDQRGWREALAAIQPHEDDGPQMASLIFSAHDFRGRPRDLIQTIETMTNEPLCKVMKLAWRARSVRDNLEAFDLLTERRKPTIAVCMGEPPEIGLMSRVLAPKFGGLLTFATDSPENETAPGQPTIEELRGLYRFDSIGKQTKVYGVIGWPVGHSASPALHNAGFETLGHDGVYLPLPVPTEYEHFKATVGSLIDHPRLDFRGASVTLPHKEHLVQFVRERGGRMDALSETIGAANTLIVGSAGGLECRNTDAPAIVRALCDGLACDESALAAKRVAVLGAGGVARAAVAAVSQAGAKVVMFNRTREKAEGLAADFHGSKNATGGLVHVVAGKDDALDCGCFDIIINCTSMGMTGGPAPDDSPLAVLASDTKVLDETVTVFETVYTPRETPLVKEAREAGATVIHGDAMFIRQAAMQFEAWTKHEAPIDLFERVLAAGLT